MKIDNQVQKIFTILREKIKKLPYSGKLSPKLNNHTFFWIRLHIQKSQPISASVLAGEDWGTVRFFANSVNCKTGKMPSKIKSLQ